MGAAYAGTVGGVPIDKVQRALTLQRKEARVPFLRSALARQGPDSVGYAASRRCLPMLEPAPPRHAGERAPDDEPRVRGGRGDVLWLPNEPVHQ